MKLDDTLEHVFRLSSYQKKALTKLGLKTTRDLLFYFPVRYENAGEIKHITEAKNGDELVLVGMITNIQKRKSFRTKIPLTEATVADETGKIKAVWFHQPYIENLININLPVELRGKITERRGIPYMANPQIKNVNAETPHVASLFAVSSVNPTLEPIYSESRGVTSRWFMHVIQKLLAARIHEILDDPIPQEILTRYHLPKLQTALVWIHAPRKNEDAMAARKRFAFEEIFFIQLSRLKTRHEYQKNPSFQIEKPEKSEREFIERFPFPFTQAQQRAIEVIVEDFKKEKPMSRLLEGDVGSGKTAVAATTAYTIVTSRPKDPETGGTQSFGNLQTAVMAPTEILAKQHFDSFIEYFGHLPIQIALITRSGCKKFPSKVNPHEATDISRTQLLKWVKNGEIPILIGTHSLIQKTVRFKHLAYVIIDEQHRFGTAQRLRLARKEKRVPHLLTMTATPIPRTLALTLYGDLDLTLLDEMPPGRKPVITEVVFPKERKRAYERVRKELSEGRQAYVICPKIELGSGILEVKNVTDEAARLKKEVFPEYSIEILHSKLKPAEKEKVMEQFLTGTIHILIATSVIEVGVNVPNATTIIIEGADRFGLAQLHQLRGRVLRSNQQAYCFTFSDSKSDSVMKRLKALEGTKNGFELAELDLKMRGAGELSGRKQWGISDIGMEAVQNLKMVEAARAEAQKIISTDSKLESAPLIKERLGRTEKNIHFE